MNDFVTVPLEHIRLDASKRVNYTLGLVLGVDEFMQEQTYFLEKDRLQNRALHGYGTVHGLQVKSRKNEDTGDPEIVVSPGMAVDQQGRNICIPEAQCGSLKKWLEKNQEEITGQERLPLYVVLSYRECETDQVPIPGGPCRTQEESMTGSRITEDFELSFTLNKPYQIEEDTIRKFGELLHKIEITDEPGEFLSEDQLNTLVQKLGEDPSPLQHEHYRIHPDNASRMLRSAFRIWATEVRTSLFTGGYCGGTLGETEEAGILLAELDVGLEDRGGGEYQVLMKAEEEGENDEDKKFVPDVVVDPSDRPYLLSTRLLQEWIMFGGFRRETIESQAFASLDLKSIGKDECVISIWIHYPEKLKIEKGDILVRVNDNQVGGHEISATDIDHIFELTFPNPPQTSGRPVRRRTPCIRDGDRIQVEFNAESIQVLSRPRQTLLEALENQDDLYLYRFENKLFAYLIVDWPELDDISNVEASSPDDGEMLTWNEEENYWEPDTRIHELDNLSDVEASTPDDGDVLSWDEEENHWKPDHHEHVMNSLKDVISPAPNNGDILVLDQNGKSLWKPKPHTLDTLIDVNVSSPENEQVLSWNARDRQWKPRTSQMEGAFVHAPSGPYAIIGAGFFNDDGEPIGETYNELEADHISTGIYRLTTPFYYPRKHINYIVKVTPINPVLSKAYQEGENGEGEFDTDMISQASIQISRLHKDFIELWITQPVLYTKQSNVDLRYDRIDKPFMVEVSLYVSEDPDEIEKKLKGIPKRIDLNTASVEKVEALPRLGPVLAERVVAKREEHGEFKTVEELTTIPGISRETVREIRRFITLGR